MPGNTEGKDSGVQLLPEASFLASKTRASLLLYFHSKARKRYMFAFSGSKKKGFLVEPGGMVKRPRPQ